MRKGVFVDTSAWYALYVPDDENHAAAWDWYRENQAPLVVTDYIVDEILTLLRRRGETRRAVRAGRLLLESPAIIVERVSLADFDEAWQVFQRFGDKAWSFTDCTSRVVMQRLEIETALAFDEHFRQFGTVGVVPG